ncbi:MAG: arylesterase [Methylobacterium sp.]|nr:arylesterase [Methylobacterium sp.]
MRFRFCGLAAAHAARPFFASLAVLWGFLMAGTMAEARTIRLVALGDSLTAGYQLAGKDAFPSVLEAALKAKGHEVVIENAGVSGDTTTGGLERLDWSVPDGTDGVILELGANDALRGLDPAIPEKALDQILTRLKARNIPVLIAGMHAPRNNGEAYAKAFDAIYPRLAQKHGAMLYPFFLDGLQGDAKLNLADGIHPNPAGVRVIVERILPTVEAFLKSLPKA